MFQETCLEAVSPPRSPRPAARGSRRLLAVQPPRGGRSCVTETRRRGRDRLCDGHRGAPHLGQGDAACCGSGSSSCAIARARRWSAGPCWPASTAGSRKPPSRSCAHARSSHSADYERIAALVERRVASDQALDRARSELGQIAGAHRRPGRHGSRSYVLRAPVSGVVLRQDGEVGEVAEPGTVLFWVGEPKPLLVVAEVNEEDIPARRGRPARRSSRPMPFRIRCWRRRSTRITPKGDPVTKTYRDPPGPAGRHAAADRHDGRGQHHRRASVRTLCSLPGHRRSRAAAYSSADGGVRAAGGTSKIGIRGTGDIADPLRPRRGHAGSSRPSRTILPTGLQVRAEEVRRCACILDIALTHIAGRGRQTLVAILGVGARRRLLHRHGGADAGHRRRTSSPSSSTPCRMSQITDEHAHARRRSRRRTSSPRSQFAG